MRDTPLVLLSWRYAQIYTAIKMVLHFALVLQSTDSPPGVCRLQNICKMQNLFKNSFDDELVTLELRHTQSVSKYHAIMGMPKL